MNDDMRFGETDHAELAPDDVLARAIEGLPVDAPRRDLWPGVSERLTPAVRTEVTLGWAQLAVAATVLIAVSSGLTWLVAHQPAAVATEPVVVASSEPVGQAEGGVQQANFAEAQYDAAVNDLERILRDERDRLDPRTVMVIERNLRTIDAAIDEARRALDADPANPYLNSHLADARRRKLELLRRATELASTGGD